MLQPTAVHVYAVRPRKDHRGIDLLSDALPFGRLWYEAPEAVAQAIGYASETYDFIRDVIQTHEREGDFKEF